MIYLKTDINIPIKSSLCGIFTADDSWIHMERIIDSYELILVTKGTIFIQQDYEKYIINKGDILLLTPGLKHKGYSFSAKGTRFYWVHFYCNCQTKTLNSSEVLSEISIYKNNPYFDGFNSSILIPTFYKNLNIEKINILFRQLLHISQSNSYNTYSTDYILTSLLIEISNQVIHSFLHNTDNNKYSNTLNEILQWIDNNITQNISLQNVAYEFNFSKEYLARYFKKSMGMSMQTYINNLRLSKSKNLLLNSNLNIKEISKELGFIDEKYFLKLFKKYENITPKQYRNAFIKAYLNNY